MKQFLILIILLAAVMGIRIASATEPTVGAAVQPAPVAVEGPLPVVVPEAPVAVPVPVSVPVAPVINPSIPAAAPVIPAVQAPKSECEITHAASGVFDVWGVYGYSTLPRGTVFTYTLTADGVTQTVVLASKAGGVLIHGTQHGNPDGYTDDGTSVFGNVQTDIPVLTLPHGPVTASVTQAGVAIC